MSVTIQERRSRSLRTCWPAHAIASALRVAQSICRRRIVLGSLGSFLATMATSTHHFRNYWRRAAMSYLPIEDHGIIGNMRTVALVGTNGSIDWYCSPHFDSPSVFSSILDDNKGGRFQICPVAERVRQRQFYWPATNIPITRFLHQDGIVELEDFMPVGLPADSNGYHCLYRRIRGVRGTVRISLVCQPAFDYGEKAHEVQITQNGASFSAPGVRFSLCS